VEELQVSEIENAYTREDMHNLCIR